jgi:hypothetical protein
LPYFSTIAPIEKYLEFMGVQLLPDGNQSAKLKAALREIKDEAKDTARLER